MRRPGNRLGQERGSTIVLALVSLTAVLAASALAVDVGMLVAARADAQGAADAAALAGAAAFIDGGGAIATAGRDRARDFATRNAILNAPIQPSEVQVEVVAQTQTVRVRIERPVTDTWFARLLRDRTLAIRARASAVAVDARSASCVKPFSVADPALVNPNNPELEVGQRLVLTPGSPSIAPQTGNGGGPGGPPLPATRSWAPPTNRGWTGGCGGTNAAAHTPPAFRANICSCNQSVIDVSVPATLTVPAAALGNVFAPDGINRLVSQDPGARWDPVARKVVGSAYRDWRQSPRVVTIPLYDPRSIQGNRIRFTRFVTVFVERLQDSGNTPSARYVGYKRVLRLTE